MGLKEQYVRRKDELLADGAICPENRTLFSEFFDYLEYKLKRVNQLPEHDSGCYRTLLGYVRRFRNVNSWFANKPWKDLGAGDIQSVYDGLEDGRILNNRGTPFKDRMGYYNKVFKSKPFAMAGKEQLARQVIAFSTTDHDRQVRFATEDAFLRLVENATKPRHRLLLWLAWDIGENVGALLKLTPRHFSRQAAPHTGDAEYLVRLPQNILKRSRRARTEPTLYADTVRWADSVLADTADDAPLFPFSHRYALVLIKTLGKRGGAVCEPYHDTITWKDLRSGMACHLLKNGWSRDEVNARLGHTPSSNVLNAYINYLALDRHEPKRKLQESQVEQLRKELAHVRQHEKLARHRLEQQAARTELLHEELRRTQTDVRLLRLHLEHLMGGPKRIDLGASIKATADFRQLNEQG